MGMLSLRARLTLWYTIALLVVLSLFGADVLWQQGRLGLRRVDRELDALTTTLENVVRDELTETHDPAKAAEEARTTVTSPGRAVAILGPLVATWQAKSGAWRVHMRPQSFDTTTMTLLVASPLTDVTREQREVREAMLVGIPIVLLLAGGGGLWLAAVGLRPITDMARRAAAIPLTGLDDLGETDRTDELGQLARAFNGLVARLRAALQTQRQFMADASHELRTPVSVVRTAAEVTLSRDRRSRSSAARRSV
jgi:signal transduction histidine kinase